jgi:hypothetical protein
MSPQLSRGLLAVALLSLACADAPTEPTVDKHRATRELDILFPAFDPSMLVVRGRTNSDGAAAEGVPLAVSESEEPPPLELPEEDLSSLYAAIYDPGTIAGVGSGEAWARGEHSYQGNKGRIETTVNVAADGQQLGSQRAVTENSRSFLLDFGLVKYISAFARAYTASDCGLSAWGASEHSAWWEAVIGGSPSTHGRAERSTQSRQARTVDCAPPENGTYGGLIEPSGASYCWVSIWYDLWTGEVIRLDVLYCG